MHEGLRHHSSGTKTGSNSGGGRIKKSILHVKTVIILKEKNGTNLTWTSINC